MYTYASLHFTNTSTVIQIHTHKQLYTHDVDTVVESCLRGPVCWQCRIERQPNSTQSCQNGFHFWHKDCVALKQLFVDKAKATVYSSTVCMYLSYHTLHLPYMYMPWIVYYVDTFARRKLSLISSPALIGENIITLNLVLC